MPMPIRVAHIHMCNLKWKASSAKDNIRGFVDFMIMDAHTISLRYNASHPSWISSPICTPRYTTSYWSHHCRLLSAVS